MTGSDLPRVNDPARLAAVEATRLLDTDPETAFDELASLAAELTDAPFAFVTLVDEHRSFWKARIGIGDDGPRENLVEESFCQYVVATGEPLIAGDVAANPLTATNPSIEVMGVRAWAGFPLLSPGDQPLGSFCVVDTKVRTWTERDIETLRVLSGAAAREIALRASAARAEIAAGHLELLAEAGHTLSSTLDTEEAVARLARLVVPALGDWSMVSLVDRDGALTDVGWWHADSARQTVLDEFAGERLVGLNGTGSTLAAQRTGQPVVQQYGALELGLQALKSEKARVAYRGLNPDVYGVWPLTSDGTVHGVLVIARDAGSASFNPAELQLAQGIADRAGTVLDNARLYARQGRITDALEKANALLRDAGRHDRDVSRALQRAMLTALPPSNDLQITARYITADDHDQVGGDWYDALLPSGRAGTLMIGDVAGHDIAAATIMGQVRNLLRALRWEHDDETPAELITRLDRAMTDLGLTTLTTLLVASIEPPADDATGQRVLRWSTAGHPVPVLIDADGNPRLLDAPADPPLAVAPDLSRHDHVMEIGPGQTLLLFTDGLVETRTDSFDIRQDQMLRTLESLAGGGLDETLNGLLTGMATDSADDDIAVLAIRLPSADRPPQADRATD